MVEIVLSFDLNVDILIKIIIMKVILDCEIVVNYYIILFDFLSFKMYIVYVNVIDLNDNILRFF